MISQSKVPLYPVCIAIADLGLAGVLLLVAPALGVVMTVAALFVVAAITFRGLGHIPLRLQSGVIRDA